MAKTDYTLTPLNIASIGSITFAVDGQGNLTKVDVSCEINYGKEGKSVNVDLLPELTAAQKTIAQNFYNNLKTILTKVILQ